MRLKVRRATRRRALMLGAAGVSAVVTIRPALAQTSASVMHCSIPVPDTGRAGNYIAPDGSLVPAGTPGAFPAAGGPVSRPRTSSVRSPGARFRAPITSAARAYTNYIRRLQSGTSGFTCFASLQMPRG